MASRLRPVRRGRRPTLAATLDDLGLVVEEIELVGEGLGDVVVVRVERIAAIEGADTDPPGGGR